MKIDIRPMLPEEQRFSYTQEKEIMEHSGCIGHLRGDMGSDGKEFHTSWDDHCSWLKTDAFKGEFDTLVNSLRTDLLKDRQSLERYCRAVPESAFSDAYRTEFGFRADTEAHTYMIRCNPDKGAYNIYIYAYDKDLLNELLQPKQLDVLVVEPGEAPYVTSISPGLRSLQAMVGGHLEAVYPWSDPLVLLCDGEGKLKGKELNRALRDEDGEIYDIVAGTFLITGLGEEDFRSISPEYAKKYSQLFASPECFIRVNDKILAIPMERKPSVLKQLQEEKAVPVSNKEKKVTTREER